jgi:hypothetical protein
MARFTSALALLACAGVVSSCGLTLDYTAPEDGGMDSGPRDAALGDAAPDDALARDDAQQDQDAAEDVDAATTPCDTNADCMGGHCIHPCDGVGAGHCVSPPPCSDQQVCGCDGVVYDNGCAASEAGVEQAADPTTCAGICSFDDPADCPFGVCTACPGELPTCVTTGEIPCFLEPVCGCDGNDYLGNCAALAAGVRTFEPGFCNVGDCHTSADCGLGHYCARAACGDLFGTCTAIGPDRDPLVCGCSGRRYLDSARALVHEGLIGECDLCAALPVRCCADSGDCGRTEACVDIDETGRLCSETGVCVDLAAVTAPGTCWTDADCDPGGICLDAQICPCGAACTRADMPGSCVMAAP